MPPENSTSEASAAASSYAFGVFLVIFAAVLWSLNGAFIKLIHHDGRGPNGVTIAMYRSVVAGLFLLPLALRKRKSVSNPGALRNKGTKDITLPRRVPRIDVMLCVAAFTLMTLCFVVASTQTAAANAIILQYTSTFWVFGLSSIVLREKPGLREWPMLLLAMIGIGIIFFGSAETDLSGLLIALAAGFFYGMLTLWLRRIRSINAAVVTVLNNLGATVLLLPIVVLMQDLMVTQRSLILLIIMGVIQFGLPYYLFSLALAKVPAHHAALITMAEPVLTPIWTYAAVKEEVPRTTMVGGVLILASVLLFILSTARRTNRGVTAAGNKRPCTQDAS